MDETRLVIPFFGMLVLTALVWVYMYFRRIGYMLANKIPASAGSTPQKMSAVLPDAVNAPANNLKNLFEMPVLFYAVCLYLLWADKVDAMYVNLAFAFFLFRALHSAVHCTFNHVMTRFVLYFISALALWAMIMRAALTI